MPVMNTNYQQAFAQYKNSKVLTASPAELTLMLYDGAIKFLNIAENSIEKKDMGKAHDNIMRTERIIDYLRETLDMQYEVSQDFENMYSYISRRLIEANISKDPAILQELNGHMHEIRDTWVQVMKMNHMMVKEA